MYPHKPMSIEPDDDDLPKVTPAEIAAYRAAHPERDLWPISAAEAAAIREQFRQLQAKRRARRKGGRRP
jgi:hypothetical protein